MRRTTRLVLGTWLLLVLAACASSLTTEQRAREAVAAGYVLVQTTADATLVAYQRGAIDDNQRRQIKSQLKEALDRLKSAERLIELALWTDAMQLAQSAVDAVESQRRDIPAVAIDAS